jgi:hypothetical protein
MENYQEYYAEYEKQTRSWLKACSDEELIEIHNRDTRNPGWGTARMIHDGALLDEILSREWDAEILAERDSVGKVKTYKRSIRVRVLELDVRKILVKE